MVKRAVRRNDLSPNGYERLSFVLSVAAAVQAVSNERKRTSVFLDPNFDPINFPVLRLTGDVVQSLHRLLYSGKFVPRSYLFSISILTLSPSVFAHRNPVVFGVRFSECNEQS
jgi:hypothetical protein